MSVCTYWRGCTDPALDDQPYCAAHHERTEQRAEQIRRRRKGKGMTSTWHIKVPHRDREQLLDAKALDELPRALDDPDERNVLRALLLEERTSGAKTVGEVLDKVERAGVAERRKMLDRARERAGLDPTAKVDGDRAFTARQRSLAGLPERDGNGRAFMGCAHPDCPACPVDRFTGGHALTHVRRWWCSEHEHLAAPGDLDPWSPRITYGPSGDIRFGGDDDAEREREQAELDRARERREVRRAESAAQRAIDQRHQDGLREHYRPPAGFPGGDAA